jgi:putative transposase
VKLSPLGRILQEEWFKTGKMRPGVLLDEFMILPNHFHGILILNLPSQPAEVKSPPGMPKAPSRGVGAIVRGLKGAVTARVKREKLEIGLPIWQRNYYDRVIRNEAELRKFRRYVANNPGQWESDRYFLGMGELAR